MQQRQWHVRRFYKTSEYLAQENASTELHASKCQFKTQWFILVVLTNDAATMSYGRFTKGGSYNLVQLSILLLFFICFATKKSLNVSQLKGNNRTVYHPKSSTSSESNWDPSWTNSSPSISISSPSSSPSSCSISSPLPRLGRESATALAALREIVQRSFQGKTIPCKKRFLCKMGTWFDAISRNAFWRIANAFWKTKVNNSKCLNFNVLLSNRTQKNDLMHLLAMIINSVSGHHQILHLHKQDIKTFKHV